MTIAISTLISAFNSLTLSPALAAALLRPHDAKPDLATRVVDRGAGWIFRPFNRFFHRASEAYGRGVARVLRVGGSRCWCTSACSASAPWACCASRKASCRRRTRSTSSRSLSCRMLRRSSRTEDVIHRMSDIFMKEPGVESVIAFSGMNVTSGFGIASNSGVIFATLDPQSKRGKGLAAQEIQQRLQMKMFGIEDAFIGVVMPPPVMGMGTLGGFKMQIEDRSSLGYQGLQSRAAGASSRRPTRPRASRASSPATSSTCRRSTPTSTA